MYPYLAELIGTTIFIFLGLSVNASNMLEDSFFHRSGALFTFFGWGLSYSLTALCFYNISGAYFNPIIPFSLAVVGYFNWVQVPGYILAECLGAFLGALLMYLFYKDQFDQTDSPTTILNVFTSDAAIANMGLNLWCEIIISFLFIFFLINIIYKFSDLSAIWYGIVLFTVANALGGTTGFDVNPASDLMGRVAHQILPIPNKKDSNWGYAIVPLVGSFVGGILGALFANLLANIPVMI